MPRSPWHSHTPADLNEYYQSLRPSSLGVSWHNLRHSGCSLLRMAGLPQAYIVHTGLWDNAQNMQPYDHPERMTELMDNTPHPWLTALDTMSIPAHLRATEPARRSRKRRQ